MSDPNRLKTDQELEPFSNERHAIIQVKGEKEVLLFLKDFAETGLSLLQVRECKIYLILKTCLYAFSLGGWSVVGH